MSTELSHIIFDESEIQYDFLKQKAVLKIINSKHLFLSEVEKSSMPLSESETRKFAYAFTYYIPNSRNHLYSTYYSVFSILANSNLKFEFDIVVFCDLSLGKEAEELLSSLYDRVKIVTYESHSTFWNEKDKLIDSVFVNKLWSYWQKELSNYDFVVSLPDNVFISTKSCFEDFVMNVKQFFSLHIDSGIVLLKDPVPRKPLEQLLKSEYLPRFFTEKEFSNWSATRFSVEHNQAIKMLKSTLFHPVDITVFRPRYLQESFETVSKELMRKSVYNDEISFNIHNRIYPNDIISLDKFLTTVDYEPNEDMHMPFIIHATEENGEYGTEVNYEFNKSVAKLLFYLEDTYINGELNG